MATIGVLLGWLGTGCAGATEDHGAVSASGPGASAERSSLHLAMFAMAESFEEQPPEDALACALGCDAVNAVFQKWLLRAPNDDELTQYCALASVAAVDAMVSGSPEAGLVWAIKQAYLDYVGRRAEPGEVRRWIDLNPGASREAILRGIALAPEAQRDMIRRAYAAMLGREPTDAEYATWLGAGRAELYEDIRQLAGEISLAYRQCLARPATPDEIAFHLTPAAAGERRANICGSPEAERVARIRRAYALALGRRATDDEVRRWMNDPRSTFEIAQDIWNSPEAASVSGSVGSTWNEETRIALYGDRYNGGSVLAAAAWNLRIDLGLSSNLSSATLDGIAARCNRVTSTFGKIACAARIAADEELRLGGVCRNVTSSLVSILERMGIDAATLAIPFNDEAPHAVVVVWVDGQRYIVDATRDPSIFYPY